MSGFRLQIVTTEGSLFDGEAEALRLRTSEGYVSIRAGHADYIAALDIGMVTVTQNGESRNAACGGVHDQRSGRPDREDLPGYGGLPGRAGGL